MRKSEIRDSQIRDLLDKVRKRNYGFYLRSLFIKRMRHIAGATLTFDFPVTALVGPNGSGKSTVLAAAACAYSNGHPRQFFFTSIVGDQQTFSWEIEFELIDKSLSPQDALRGATTITKGHIELNPDSQRPVEYFGIHRTLPPVTSPLFMRKYLAGKSIGTKRTEKEVDIEFVRSEASKILGKELSSFKLIDISFEKTKKKKKKKVGRQIKRFAERLGLQISEIEQQEPDVLELEEDKYVRISITRNQQIFVSDGVDKYSEFNFGAGEASVLRLVYGIEQMPEQSLILIEEIENGLHPLAVERLIEYLIAVAARRKIQVIFTTHSDHALFPLPSEAVWAVLNGRLIQGRLSIDSLRALSGRIDKKLAIFTEDDFSQRWVEALLREKLGQRFEEVGVYKLFGDGVAVSVHLAHNKNPAISFHSICLLDGDSKQLEEPAKLVFRLPGQSPELAVFDVVRNTLDKNAAILTAACQRSLSAQDLVVNAVKEVANTNRDPHLLFSQIGNKIGLVSEEIIRGAFFSVWIQENPDASQRLADLVLQQLEAAT